jgi:hypothetical protein
MAQHRRRQSSSYSPPWEPEASLPIIHFVQRMHKRERAVHTMDPVCLKTGLVVAGNRWLRCPGYNTPTHIREVPGSNLSPETGYPDRSFLWCSSVSLGKCRDSALH